MFADISELFSSTDSQVIILFLMVTLFVSYKYSKSVTTVTEYALASRKLSLPIISMTFMATAVGANVFLGAAEDIFTDGLIRVLFQLYSIPLFCFWIYIAYKRFDARFDKHITMGDMFKYFLGVRIEKIVVFLFVIYTLIAFAIQVSTVANVGSYLFPHSYKVVAIIAATIVIIYSSLGGMRAVAITDVLQFGFMVLVLPYMAHHAVNAAGGMGNIFTPESLKLENFSDSSKISSYAFTIIECMMPYVILLPHLVQRFLMTPLKQRKQNIKFMSLAMMVFSLLISISIMAVAFAAVQICPDEKPDLIFPRIMKDTLPAGAKGIVMVGLLSAIMSTADSLLNSGSVLFVRNMLTDNIPEKRKLNLMTITAIVIGVIGCTIALRGYNIKQLSSYTGSMCILATYVLFLGIMRVKIEEISFWIGLTVYATIAIVIRNFFPDTFTTYQDTFIMDFSGVIAFTVSNIIINRGLKFVGSKDEGKTITRKDVYRIISKSSKNTYHLLCRRLYELIPGGHRLYVKFCVFYSIALLIPFFLFSIRSLPEHHSILFHMKLLALLLSVSMGFKAYWTSTAKGYFPTIFKFSVSFMLVFIPFFMSFCSNFSTELLVSSVISVFMLIIITRMPNTLFLFILGVSSSIYMYSTSYGWDNVVFLGERFYMMLYLYTFGLAILIMLSWKRDSISRERYSALINMPINLRNKMRLPEIAPRVFQLRMDMQDFLIALKKDLANMKFEEQYTSFKKMSQDALKEECLEKYNKEFKDMLQYAQDEIGYELINGSHLFAYKDEEPWWERYYDIQSCLATATDIYTNIHIKEPHDRFNLLEDMEANFLVYAHPKELAHFIWCIIENLASFDKPEEGEELSKLTFIIDPEKLQLVIKTSKVLIPREDLDEWMGKVSFITNESMEYGMGIIREKLYEKYRIKVLYDVKEEYNEIILQCPKVPLEVEACLTDRYGRLDFVHQNLQDPKRYAPWK